ncbi:MULTISPECIES: PAS domain-containing sensor histidine kinase [Niastella]|uniref:PAS domain S-box protein n=1 Tax=Niastella soli TaxID=2821487 RepID=A0ABS3YVW3_9BACT|nr:PAS domain S-box protein [Niastella soli]MBO9202008.1 PAS domain S-box protein [Niastella soli]
MDTSMPAINNRSEDVILVSIEKKSGVINGIWPKEARLHGVAGKRCIGKKILSFLIPASKAVFKNAVSKKNKQPAGILQLEFCSKKLPDATYDCSIWNVRKQPLVLMIHRSASQSSQSSQKSQSHMPQPDELIAWEKAEKLVLAAENKFKRILEKMTTPIAVYEVHEPKRFVFINPKFTEWFGYTIEDIPTIDRWGQQAYRDEVHFRTLQKGWQAELKLVYHGEKYESRPFESKVYCKDGTIKELEFTFTTDENLVFVNFNDITERNSFLRALHENEKKFRDISEQLPIPICVFSDAGETKFVNNAFVDTFGYTRDDIPTHKEWLNKAYPNENYRNVVNAARENAISRPNHKTRSTLICQFEVNCKDGSKKHIEFSASKGNKNLYLVANDITGKVKAEQELKQSHRQLRELSSYLENIREEERKHISREIHDELGQQLTLLKLDLLQMSKKLPPEAKEMIEKMRQADLLLAETMRSVRKIATQLRPSILDNLGLVSALEWQSREFEKNFGIRCIFESLLYEPQFTTKQSNALFRIYQEALTNIARHASATQVDAVLSMEENRIVLEIRDNGKGFNPNDMAHKKTLGLKGMQERALMIDGDFHIDSTPGKGTYIQISIPILITNHEISQQ